MKPRPRLQGSPEGERFMRGCLLGIFLALIFWAVMFMVTWTWVLS